MRSLEERLSASDPSAQGYEHPHFDAMVSRVIATPAPRRDATWRAFRLRVAGAVAATGVLTGAGIAALSSAGLSLPVLSFAAPASHQAPSSAKYDVASGTSFAPMMLLQRNYQFTGSANFSADRGSATVYSLQGPTDPVATLTAAASALGVDVGTPAPSDSSPVYIATGPTFVGSLDAGSGFATWTIQRKDQSGVTSTGASAATDAFTATALADARRLGSFDLGTPTAEALGGDGAAPVAVRVPIDVGGMATDFAYDFTFDADGALLSADGVSFTYTSVGDYPLISPSDGVAQINAQIGLLTASVGFWFAAGAGTTVTGVGTVAPPAGVNGSSSGSSPGNPPAPSAVDTTSTTVPAIMVNLTGETTQYGAYAMASGSTLLLPVYVYSGSTVDQNSPDTFRVVPVDPAYLDLSMVVSPRLY